MTFGKTCLTFPCAMLKKMAKYTFKNFSCEHRKIFKGHFGLSSTLYRKGLITAICRYVKQISPFNFSLDI